MENQKLGRQTFQPGTPPVIIGHGSAAGKKESQGPLGRHFDHTCQDDAFGCETWEKSESAMQQLALDAALKRAGLRTPDLDLLLAGDLLNQCIGTSFGLRDFNIPFYGLYGACSTIVWQLMGEAGYSVTGRPALATALYYGLYMDTGMLQELRNAYDRTGIALCIAPKAMHSDTHEQRNDSFHFRITSYRSKLQS